MIDMKLAFFVWVAMVVIAIANGIFGEKVVSPAIGAYPGHLYRVGVACAVIFAFGHYYALKTAGGDPWYLGPLAAGVQWFFSSLIFEFLFGHYVFGLPWQKITSEYRIMEGKLWSLVLLSELVAPVINAWFLKR